MEKATLAIRILLGLVMLIFGLNKFLNFIPLFELALPAQNFMEAFIETKYMLSIIAIVEIIAGVLLLMNKYVAIALIVLFPILLNAFFFHMFLDIGNIGAALIAIAMNVFLFFAYKDKYSSLLKP